jgi:hypothetical protein
MLFPDIGANRLERQEFLHIDAPFALLFSLHTISIGKTDSAGNGLQVIVNHVPQ